MSVKHERRGPGEEMGVRKNKREPRRGESSMYKSKNTTKNHRVDYIYDKTIHICMHKNITI